MKLIIEENTKAMGESAMHIVLGAMMQDKQVNISLTAGKSPIEMYEMMIPKVKDKPQYKNIQYYIFDDAPYPGKSMGLFGMKCKIYSLEMRILKKKEFMQSLMITGKLLMKI